MPGVMPLSGSRPSNTLAAGRNEMDPPVGPENPNQLKVLTFDAARLAR
jgi:hypothetical protein